MTEWDSGSRPGLLVGQHYKDANSAQCHWLVNKHGVSSNYSPCSYCAISDGSRVCAGSIALPVVEAAGIHAVVAASVKTKKTCISCPNLIDESNNNREYK